MVNPKLFKSTMYRFCHSAEAQKEKKERRGWCDGTNRAWR